MIKVLLVIDVQPSFVKDIRFVEYINKYIQMSDYDYIYATVFMNYDKSNFVNILEWSKVMKEEIPLIKYDELFIKHGYGIDNYSVLPKDNYHYDVCGMDTEACVMKVAMDLFDKGYNFNVLSGLCMSSGGIGIHEAGIECLSRSIGKALIK